MKLRRLLLAAAGVASIVVAAIGVSPISQAASPPGYSIATLSKYGGEPSIVSEAAGSLYDSSPSIGTLTYRSTDHGASWKQVTTADPSSGDDCLATDQTGAVYLCNLAGSSETAPLQADVFKSTDHGQSWTRGDIMGTGSVCGTSCSPFGVDRDWVAASIPPPFSDTGHAEVVLMYHDFYGPSEIWVNVSHDGGAHFMPPQPVLLTAFNGDPTTAVKVNANTFCNTVPAGVAIAPPGTPHAGRIFVAWIAADPVQNLTGCNVTMLQSFHNLFLSYSDDNGVTWAAQQAFDAGLGHDASTPFTSFAIDNQGNPYFAFTINLQSDPTCATPNGGTPPAPQAKCEYDAYLVWSSDQGSSWSGAYRVSPLGETGTHQFPTISAGDPGKVIVGYLRTTFIEPTSPNGKFLPGGCAGPTTIAYAVGPCPWNLYAAESVNLGAGTSGATWAVTQITTTPMHVGDICNLGIFCTPGISNRHLLDFNMSALDPQGCNHIAYADDNTVNKLRVANQTSSCLPNSGQHECHEGDGGGEFRGDHGNGDFNFDGDGCLDGDQDSVDSNDRGDGEDFHATRIDSIALNGSGTTETISGVGLSGGVPVSFVFVVAQASALTPGVVTFTFSDGFSNTGPLTSGTISLH